MQTKYLSNSSANPPGLLRKTGAIIATTVLAGVALMFSAALLAVLLCVGAVAFTYLWWKTRELRKQMRAQMQNFPPPHGATMQSKIFAGEEFKGEVIEGEVIRN